MHIGEALQRAGLISSDSLKKALEEQERSHNRLGDIVLSMGFTTAEKMAPVLAQYFQIPYLKLKDVYKDIKSEVIDIVPIELARRFSCIPVECNEKTLTVAMFDPLNLQAIDTLRIKTGYKIQVVISSENDISEAIEYCYMSMGRMTQDIESFLDLESETETLSEKELEGKQFEASDQPVVKYVKSMIIQAVTSRASDIHLQPKEDKPELRFRIDSVLYTIAPPPKAMVPAITTRIKILAGLDIAERRLPQDGRFKVKVGKTEVDLRVSSFPTIYGESMVLRILDTSQPLMGIEKLGLYPDDLEKFRKIITQSYGLVLVTGPTGSGKTTTLYTTLNEIKSSEKNIITLEDPVEYRLGFIQQSQVNTQIGFDFAKGLRSILRQDPDVIMVGEIRDHETAEIAMHAALTGHLVFSTLHTNDAAGASTRLTKMGIEPFLLTSSLLAVIAQRLIRTVCPHCVEKHKMDKEVLNMLPFKIDLTHFVRGRGCPKCMNSGYMGRQGIYELLVPNEDIRRSILARHSSEEIRAKAQKAGMKTLRQIGLEKLKEGVTTPEEILRVTQETEDQ